ncbi:MAG: glycosyltransferase [Anaerolineae bacterium]|nr:glycosyltransferase [Anaerolineae bacterium]
MSIQPGSGFGWGAGRLVRRGARLGSEPPAIVERLLDGIPGWLAWASLVLVVVGSVFAPWTVFTVAAVIGAYMAARMLLAALANVVGLRRITAWEHTDWRAEYERRKRPDSLPWDGVQHMIVVPNYREDIRILRETLQRFAESPLARSQVTIVLAMEGADPQAVETATALRHEFADVFRHIIATYHPRGLKGEVAGKSSNVAWAVRHARHEMIEGNGDAIDHVVITVTDADSLLHPKYLESLNCLFATAPNRQNQMWQAPIRFHNKVWETNPALALVQIYSAAWELAYLAGWWWQAMPMSTYSLGLKMAASVDYWDRDVIAEDWHMFIKCYYRRRGRFAITPIYLPFKAYTVGGNGFLDSCRNRYAQTLRHAWGAKEIGYTLTQMIANPTAFTRSTRVFLRVSHDNLMAGAGWVIMSFGTQLPFLLNPDLLGKMLSTPQYLLIAFSLASVAVTGLIFWSADMQLRPAKPKPWTLAERLLTLASFLALPVLVLVLVAVPVIEAQTRLMLGIPLHYKVARKI